MLRQAVRRIPHRTSCLRDSGAGTGDTACREASRATSSRDRSTSSASLVFQIGRVNHVLCLDLHADAGVIRDEAEDQNSCAPQSSVGLAVGRRRDRIRGRPVSPCCSARMPNAGIVRSVLHPLPLFRPDRPLNLWCQCRSVLTDQNARRPVRSDSGPGVSRVWSVRGVARDAPKS